MLSHDLAKALLSRRNNDVQVEFLADAPDGDQFELRRVELRDGGFLAEPERVTSDEVVVYDADRDVIIIRAGFVATGTAPYPLGHAFEPGGDDSAFGDRGTWCAVWITRDGEEDQCGLPPEQHDTADGSNASVVRDA